TAARLRTLAARRLEAEVLYLGIVRYFMRRAPVLEQFAAVDAEGRADTLFAQTPGLEGEVGGAFDAATLKLDGVAVAADIAGGRVRGSRPARLAAGGHEASLTARLATEGSARAKRIRFHVEKPVARLTLSLIGEPLAPARALLGARVGVLDADGLP